MLKRFFWYKVPCLSESSADKGIMAPVDRDSVLRNVLMIQFSGNSSSSSSILFY